uniref:Purkinje cell protein 4 n=1 Tax=Oreochromis aureus TaxID=47969 RepID=A0A668V240_OREAU
QLLGVCRGTASGPHAIFGCTKKKNNLPQDFDIDMDAPETAKAAVTIQSQFRKFQKKKQDVKS